jgi:hypothetical protein
MTPSERSILAALAWVVLTAWACLLAYVGAMP